MSLLLFTSFEDAEVAASPTTIGWLHGWLLGWVATWLGLDLAGSSLPGQGTPTAATFALNLEQGYRVTLRWFSDVIDKRSGREQRRRRNDDAKEIYDGNAMMFDTMPIEVRARMARFAVAGSAFAIGLPHEELTLSADAAGATCPVSTTAYSDWLVAGQRVVVVHGKAYVEGVVQSYDAGSITLDVAPGAVGKRGARIMPLVAIYLDPEQAFPRYRTKVERWNIKARAADFGFARPLASLALGPLTVCPGLEDAVLTERIPGSDITVVFETAPNLSISEADGVLTVRFRVNGGNLTTAAEIHDALLSSAYVAPSGTWGGDDMDLLDAFGPEALVGGSAHGLVGTGAAVTTYAGHPVWDERISNDATNTDSLQALTRIIDHGGVPISMGFADAAKWGRAVIFAANGLAAWQWLKLFLYTVKGRQKAFWLPTWRDDLPCIAKAPGSLTVEADVGAWWPAQREHIQIEETDGTITYDQITNAVDNGDGTWTLTIASTIAGTIKMVSWLELARFTSDDFQVTFGKQGFRLETVATVVPE